MVHSGARAKRAVVSAYVGQVWEDWSAIDAFRDSGISVRLQRVLALVAWVCTVL